MFKPHILIPSLILLGACAAFIPAEARPARPPPLAEAVTDIAANARMDGTPGTIEQLPDGGVRLSTLDGLTLALDSAGQVTALTLNGDPLLIEAVPPLLVRDLSNANARGAAWISAVGLREISFGDVAQLVRFNHIYQPNPQHRALYDERFDIFTQIYKQMKGVYRRLNG